MLSLQSPEPRMGLLAPVLEETLGRHTWVTTRMGSDSHREPQSPRMHQTQGWATGATRGSSHQGCARHRGGLRGPRWALRLHQMQGQAETITHRPQLCDALDSCPRCLGKSSEGAHRPQTSLQVPLLMAHPGNTPAGEAGIRSLLHGPKAWLFPGGRRAVLGLRASGSLQPDPSPQDAPAGEDGAQDGQCRRVLGGWIWESPEAPAKFLSRT